MPELQPHVAFDSEEWLIHTICCTNVFRMGESSDELGSMTVVLVVEYTGENTVPRTCLNFTLFCCLRMLGFIVVDDVHSRLWRSSGRIHAEVEPSFPFQKTSLVLVAYPRSLLEKYVIEN